MNELSNRKALQLYGEYDPDIGKVFLEYLITNCQSNNKPITLTKLCRMPGMPPLVVVKKWQKANKEFAALIQSVKDTIAQTVYDDLVEGLEETKVMDEDQVRAHKVYLKQAQMIIEKGSKEEFGNTKDSSTNVTITNIVVDTGIDTTPVENFDDVMADAKTRQHEMDEALDAEYKDVNDGKE